MNNAEPKIVSWEIIKPHLSDLTCKYEAYPFAIIEKRDPGLPGGQFLLYEGNVELDELDLDIEDYMSMVILGDLHVKGSIINENTDGACTLIVRGNLKAKNVCVGGQYLYITGNIEVEEMLMGIYNHGEFYCNGTITCPAVIADDYRFHLSEDAGVRVLNFHDDDDKEVIKEILIDELFDEDDWFVYYSTIREKVPLLKPVVHRTEITTDDLAALLDGVALLGPDNYEVAFSEAGWYITLDRGGSGLDEEGNPSPAMIIAIHLDQGKYYNWYVADDTIVTLVKQGDDWVAVKANEDTLRHFSLIEGIIHRKEKWNSKHMQEFDQEAIWKLIWLFRNEQDDATYQIYASAIYRRVLYAAMYPFPYIFAKYKEEAKYRGLAESPEWAPASALLDGLIEYELIQEITRQKPLAEQMEKLDKVTSYNWDTTFEIDERYQTQPIDKLLLQELNTELASLDGALLRLDVGISPFILAGMHVNDLDIFNQLIQPLGIYPKYFTADNDDEEVALKEVAIKLLATTQSKVPDQLNPFRQYQDTFWNYVYNERGHVDFWQQWMEKLQDRLTDEAGTAYLFRDEEDAEPIHPELKHWIDWCERYEKIAEGSNIILPEE